ncbi:DNA repair exonuclease [Oscillospiraceae bacterium WX1]
MPVKILHAADLHMDSPFEALTDEMAARRRREQRTLLDKIADLTEEEGVSLVLLSGDLLDSANSYYETQEVLQQAFSRMKAHVFIAPGNHDYYCPKSPYAYVRFPDNVHIFTSPLIRFVDLPELGCRVWGAGFNDTCSRPLLSGFSAPDSGYLNIMTLHGDTAGDMYNPIREAEIAASNLDYLALGHIHFFSGFQTAGKTTYAYPGCPEGRGFDETGEKGVILGSVSKDGCNLRFKPLGGRAYKIQTVDLTGALDTEEAVISALPNETSRDIYKLILTGTTDRIINPATLKSQLADRFFDLTIKNMTKPARDIWASAGDDTLRGIFLRELKNAYDAADEQAKDTILRALRYGISALNNGEEPV